MITLIISILTWFSLCIYTDWKMYYANRTYMKKNEKHYTGSILINTPTFSDRYAKGLCFIFYPILLIIFLLVNGLKILKKDRSIFSGDVL